jgi:hypothetical protein
MFKKLIDLSVAENEMQNYLLFGNMIEYPINGISKDAK